jgi:purine-binding chemotaxis protein CheW
MQQLVVFALGDEEYGLPITQVQEIIRYSEPRTVPNPQGSIRGVINLRDRIIPICDLKQHLNVTGAGAEEAEGKIVIVESPAGSAGLVVDGVNEVMAVTEEQLENGTGSRDAYLSGIVKVGERLIILIDPTGLIDALGITADVSEQVAEAA